MWSIWLCGRLRRPRPAAHRARPPGQEPGDPGTPEVAVAGDDDGALVAGELGQEPAQLGGRAVGEPGREVHAHEVDRRAVDVEDARAVRRARGWDRRARCRPRGGLAPRRGCGSRSPARRRPRRHRRGGRGARARGGRGRSAARTPAAPIDSPNRLHRRPCRGRGSTTPAPRSRRRRSRAGPRRGRRARTRRCDAPAGPRGS